MCIYVSTSVCTVILRCVTKLSRVCVFPLPPVEELSLRLVVVAEVAEGDGGTPSHLVGVVSQQVAQLVDRVDGNECGRDTCNEPTVYLS